MKNRTVYLPAMSVGAQRTAIENNDLTIKGKSIKFYNKKENPIFYYPYLLISAGHNYENNTKEAMGLGDYGKNTIIFGDSGGFQIATGKLKLNKDNFKRIFLWLEKNTNYSANLDIPPYVSTKTIRSGYVFNESLDLTVRNMRLFDKYQSGSTKYLNVLHGRSRSHFDRWYSAVKDFEFSGGWAIGSVSISLYLILYAIFYLFEKGEIEKYSGSDALIHIFGSSVISSMASLIYLQNKFNGMGLDLRVTYDSSSPFIQSANGSYVISFSNSSFSGIILSKKDVIDNEELDYDGTLPCRCPICSGITWREFLSPTNERGGFATEYYVKLGYHNLYHYIKTKKIFEDIIFFNNQSTIRSFFSSHIVKIFDIIDIAFDSNKPTKVLEQNKLFFKRFVVELPERSLLNLKSKAIINAERS